MSLTEEMKILAQSAKDAAHQMPRLDTSEKNRCLNAMADALESNRNAIGEANARDMETARSMELSEAMMDRLLLDEQRIQGMANGLREVAELPDPVGKILAESERPSGLKLKKISCPIGVIVMIYESRPNVTADAAGLCFKSGNATILRGGSEAIRSNLAIARCIQQGLSEAGLPAATVQVLDTTDRQAVGELVRMPEYVDVIVPRGTPFSPSPM